VSLKVEVKSWDDAVRVKRQATAQRVVNEFGDRLPNLRLLAFFDDEDWSYFRYELGPSNRGLYTPIKPNVQWGTWPYYVKECILVSDPSTLRLRQEIDHVIYVHGTTCADEVGLTMTFSHELQHFIQYGFNRKLWAENFLLPRLPKDVIDSTGLNWPDIPNEREARIVAKRIGVILCGADAVNQYIARKIVESVTSQDAEDWRFSQRVDPSLPYDLAGETKRIFQRLEPYRQHFDAFLAQMREDVDFNDIDLSEYFDEAAIRG
jgi:hypothetical protein